MYIHTNMYLVPMRLDPIRFGVASLPCILGTRENGENIIQHSIQVFM